MPTAHASALAAVLAAVEQGLDPEARRARDPVAFPHRYADARDRELVGLFAALLAYGRVDLIARALTDATARMGPHPAAAAAADDRAAAAGRFDGFVYRFTRGPDLARLWVGIGEVQRSGRTLEDVFLAADRPDPPGGSPDLRPALAGLRRTLLAPTMDEPEPPRRAFEHFFPDPDRGSATKRLWLYLRWMVRGPDAIDLGLWRRVSPARLTMPVDTHIHRLGRYLGLTTRPSADFRTAQDITAALRALEPADPLRWDFALTHLGIAGACARRRVPEICAGCALAPACRLDARGAVGPG
jgi:uncharacterized protein (TIGR02757 family)